MASPASSSANPVAPRDIRLARPASHAGDRIPNSAETGMSWARPSGQTAKAQRRQQPEQSREREFVRLQGRARSAAGRPEPNAQLMANGSAAPMTRPITCRSPQSSSPARDRSRHAPAGGAERFHGGDGVAPAIEMSCAPRSPRRRRRPEGGQSDQRQELREALDIAFELRRGIVARADFPAGFRKLLLGVRDQRRWRRDRSRRCPGPARDRASAPDCRAGSARSRAPPRC